MSNRFKNLVFDNKSNDKKEDTKLKENSRWKREEGDANRFLAVYKEFSRAKDVTTRRIYLETMEKVLKGINKIVIDKSAGGGVVPYLPLQELQKRKGDEQ